MLHVATNGTLEQVDTGMPDYSLRRALLDAAFVAAVSRWSESVIREEREPEHNQRVGDDEPRFGGATGQREHICRRVRIYGRLRVVVRLVAGRVVVRVVVVVLVLLRLVRAAAVPPFGIERVPLGRSRRGEQEREAGDQGDHQDLFHRLMVNPAGTHGKTPYPSRMPQADLGDIELHYKSYGEGPPVLGIMGFALDQRFWAAQVPAVTEGNRFITFDNRGTGRSTRAASTSIDEMADDALRLLDRLGIDRAVIFGASMGGTIAQRLVIDHPDRVTGLVLAVTFARPVEYTRRLMEVATRIISEWGEEEFTRASLLWMFTPPFFEIGAESVDQLVASFTAPGAPDTVSPDVLTAQLEAIAKHDVRDQLPNIGCPTLVIGARADLMAPVFASEEIADAIPGAELAIFDGGHGVMFEQMDAVNARLRSFLDGL